MLDADPVRSCYNSCYNVGVLVWTVLEWVWEYGVGGSDGPGWCGQAQYGIGPRQRSRGRKLEVVGMDKGSPIPYGGREGKNAVVVVFALAGALLTRPSRTQ